MAEMQLFAAYCGGFDQPWMRHIHQGQPGRRRRPSGLPPNVLPWSPGAKPEAVSSLASTAPIGTPPARPLARVTMSGLDAVKLAGQKMAGPAHAGLDFIDDQPGAGLAAECFGQFDIGLICRPDSAFTLDQFQQNGAGVVSDSRPQALRGHCRGHAQSRPAAARKGALYLGWPVAVAVARVRPWKDCSAETILHPRLALLVKIAAGQLDRSFVGFSAAVADKGTRRSPVSSARR